MTVDTRFNPILLGALYGPLSFYIPPDPMHWKKSKRKVLPVHAMVAYTVGGSRSIAPLILNLGNGWMWLVKIHASAALPPGKNSGAHLTRDWVRPIANMDIF